MILKDFVKVYLFLQYFHISFALFQVYLTLILKLFAVPYAVVQTFNTFSFLFQGCSTRQAVSNLVLSLGYPIRKEVFF